MSSKKTCDKCLHFTADESYKNAGNCALMGDSNDFSFDCDTHEKGFAPDRAYGWDYEGYRAGVYVTPKFGCIHWAKKGTP